MLEKMLIDFGLQGPYLVLIKTDQKVVFSHDSYKKFVRLSVRLHP